ncbi:MAG: hypothetical protein Q7J57_00760 [Gemmobacter sp.]|nr:hypothetical protein [Gemmobacter sp.]
MPVVTADQTTRMRVYGLDTVEARIVSNIGFEVGATPSRAGQCAQAM